MKVLREKYYFNFMVNFYIAICIESASVIAGANATRDEIHGLFTNFFTGDSLAADYLLCNLLSRV